MASLGIDIFFTVSVDTIGWQRLLKAVDDSFVSINPYMIEFGNEKKTLAVAKHPEILQQLRYEGLPPIEQGLARHVEDIRYKTKRRFMEVSAGLGIINYEEDIDGVLRRLPIIAEVDGMLAPHFYLRLLCLHLDYNIKNIEVKKPASTYEKWHITINPWSYDPRAYVIDVLTGSCYH